LSFISFSAFRGVRKNAKAAPFRSSMQAGAKSAALSAIVFR